MSELISLKEAIATVKEAYENDEMFDGYEYRLNELPSTEIIRCRECKHRDMENGLCEGRGWPMQLVPDDGFCDKGERREKTNEGNH